VVVDQRFGVAVGKSSGAEVVGEAQLDPAGVVETRQLVVSRDTPPHAHQKGDRR
jgi:hypothetical protein